MAVKRQIPQEKRSPAQASFFCFFVTLSDFAIYRSVDGGYAGSLYDLSLFIVSLPSNQKRNYGV